MVGATGAGASNPFPLGSSGGVFVLGQMTEAWSGTNQGAKLQVHTTPTTTAVATLAMTFQASGCLSVGTTTDCGVGSIIASKYLQSGAVAVATAGIGAVVAAGGANNVPVTCDGTNWRIG